MALDASPYSVELKGFVQGSDVMKEEGEEEESHGGCALTLGRSIRIKKGL